MKTLLLAGLAWLPVHLAPADDLKRERLPADVDLVVHLDLEGLKKTELWRHIAESAEGAELKAGLSDLEELRTRFGIDPLNDVRAVTLFKVEQEEDPTVVLFSTTPKVDEALRRFQAESGYARLAVGAIELHTWSDGGEGERVFAYVQTGSDQERVVVLASSQKSALHAARVLRGEEPSHARSGSLLTLTPARGSFLYLAAKSLPHIEDTPASQVFGLAQGIQLDLGEAGGFLRAHMGVTTGSPKDALDISNVANGLISLARLAGGELGDLLEILAGIRMNTRGSEVQVDFEFEVARLLQILEALDGGGGDHSDEVEIK